MPNPEQALWRAVIAQAITDASGKGMCEPIDRKRAHNWLLTPNRDFSRACALADLEPDYVRAQARKTLAEHGAEAISEAVRKPKRSPRNQLFEFNGRSQTLKAWAAELGCNYGSLHQRVAARGFETAVAAYLNRNA